ncbi:hypothetical protein ACQCVK_04930 [Rossellomorea vietnamensis]
MEDKKGAFAYKSILTDWRSEFIGTLIIDQGEIRRQLNRPFFGHEK